MRLRFVSRIAQVPRAAWDRLFDSRYPFTRHAFLQALETHGCVGGRSGWQAQHLLVEDEAGTLVAAAPLYEKRHSYGEFVFDFAWAEASHRLGRPYYPKLVCAVPFTPVTGPRLGAIDAAARGVLARGLLEIGGGSRHSSLHALFLDTTDAQALAEAGTVERLDLQFHWRRREEQDFDGFLAALRADKRKKIARERRRVAEAGIRFEWRRGDELDEAAWSRVYALYANTYEERGQAPYLTLDFFLDFGRQAGTPVQLALAYEDTRLVAVAITLVGGDTLYGRHWGAAERYHSLHFETCFYQGIERCLALGLSHFDAGAQGEHKLARGFLPQLTRSAHLLSDARLRAAVEMHLERERAFVQSRHAELARHSPYREEAGGHG